MTIFLTAYIVAFVVSGWAGYYFYSDYTLRATHQKVQQAQRFQTDLAYVDLPRISILRPSSNSHTGTVRMDITLEVDNRYAAELEGFRPRIADELTRYAQTLNYDDLADAKSTTWLKPDLLQEIKKAGSPAPIRDIIFRQFLVL